MRICAKHRERAVEVLRSLMDGSEYDLCPVCADEIREILSGPPEKEVKHGRTTSKVRSNPNK